MGKKFHKIKLRLWQKWQELGIRGIFSVAWTWSWMQFANVDAVEKTATWIATWFALPYKERRRLARYNSKGYTAPSAKIHHPQLQLGANIYIGDRVTIFEDSDGGAVELADRVYLHNDTCIETGNGGSLKIGSDTHIQVCCQFSAYEASITIGCGVQIAPYCCFDSGDRQIPSESSTKGEIIVDDDAWLGHGAVILAGVRIGKGAVIGSGAVVEQDIPDGAIAAGIPARIIGMRRNLV